MEKISSDTTILHKRVWPILFFAFPVLAVINGVWKQAWGREYWLWWLVLGLFFVIAVFSYWFTTRDLVDEVHEQGDLLVVRNRGDEQRIPMADIVNIETSWRESRRVIVHLAKGGRFGERIVFIPKGRFSLNPFKRNEAAKALSRKVHNAKRGA